MLEKNNHDVKQRNIQTKQKQRDKALSFCTKGMPEPRQGSQIHMAKITSDFISDAGGDCVCLSPLISQCDSVGSLI